MSAPSLHPESLAAINKLKAEIERYLDITTIVEPNNAMAAIEVRLMVTGASTLNPLPKPDGYAPFVPYEWNLPVVVCVRATGGNAGNALAGQATWINMQLANFLENELVEVRDVGQILKVPKGMMQLGPKNKMHIVGDAEITNAKFTQSGFTGDKEAADFDPFDGPFTYREDWSLTMVLTVHRDFYSPTLREVRFYNELLNEEVVVPPEEEA
ncbi:TPA: hypothetical protein ACX3IN_004852 [Vibrio parahaemolyticus]